MTHKWRAVADTLAAAMEHGDRGVCTLTNNEHAALEVYHRAVQDRGRSFPEVGLGIVGGPPEHSDHAPDPEFEVVS